MLRDYQIDTINKIRAAVGRGRKHVLCVMPTGSGKTLVIRELLLLALQKGNAACGVFTSIDVYEQTRRDYPDIAAYCYKQTAAVPNGTNFVILDEAHHATTATLAGWVSAEYVIGMTATPFRDSLSTQLGDVFQDIVLGPSVRELVGLGHLCKFRIETDTNVFRVADFADAFGDLTVRVGDGRAVELSMGVAEAVLLRCADRQTLVFCASVALSEATVKELLAVGIKAVMVTGKMMAADRRRVFSLFEAGRINCLVACDVLSEGVNLPCVSAVVLARPTKSPVIYNQQIGRGLRPCKGKTDLLVLDLVGNALRHGSPDKKQIYALPKSRQRSGGAGVTRTCGECFLAYDGAGKTCPFCGYCAMAVNRKQLKYIVKQK